MNTSENPYEILGIEHGPTARESEIKKVGLCPRHVPIKTYSYMYIIDLVLFSWRMRRHIGGWH